MNSPEPIIVPGLAHPGLAHGFFTRAGGVSDGIYRGLNCGPGSGDDPASVAENRARVARHMGLAPDNLVTLYQVHSGHAVPVEGPVAPDARPQADGMATATPGLALAILTADCVPVLFADATAGVVGAAHAGWRGAVAGIIEATLAQMERLGADRSRIAAAIGPAINQANYEVGAELREAVLAAPQGDDRFFAPSGRAGHFQFDLPAYAHARLHAADIGSISGTGCCTYADETRFFSFRRTTHRGEADYGRQISAICLKG